MQLLPEIVTTARLRLRPFTMADADALFAYSADPEWGRFQPLSQPYDRAAADRFLAELLLRDRSWRPSWAITLDEQVCGIVNLNFEQDHRIAVLGYGIHKRLWGRGLAGEAVIGVLTEAFGALEQLRRIRAQTDARNTASIRLLQKLGFRHEGTLRADVYDAHRDEFVDGAVFGLLREEWESTRR